MPNNGWIKLHRKLLEWEWYDDNKTLKLFIHILLKSNHKEKKYKGVIINQGEIMTGLQLLSYETKLSVQSVRTSLNRLKSTNEVTIKTSSQGTIIQLVNYNKYQDLTNEQQTSNKPATNEQQTNNKRITTNKNEKNEKNEKKNIYIPEFLEFLEYAKTLPPYHISLDFQIEAKYNSWKDNNWRDYNNKPIKNWKNKIAQTMPYFKKDFKTIDRNKPTPFVR